MQNQTAHIAQFDVRMCSLHILPDGFSYGITYRHYHKSPFVRQDEHQHDSLLAVGDFVIELYARFVLDLNRKAPIKTIA